MILVDSSVWIDHLRASLPPLVRLLERSQVLVHPLVVGEIALGSLACRPVVLTSLQALPQAPVATSDEVLLFIESRALHGLGIGWVDGAPLVSTALMGDRCLWSRDRRLAQCARELGVALVDNGSH